MTDEQFEALAAQFPKRTPEEAEADLQEFLNHPLNCKALTPEILAQPEFQALQQMAFEGTPVDVAKNFMKHALEQLSKVLLKQSKKEEKDIQESLYCFDQGIDQKCGDKKIEFELFMGRAKLNLLRAQFGKCKDDCLEALKRKDTEQASYVLARSRFFAEKYDECDKYTEEGLKKYPTSGKLQDLKAKCATELQKEKDTVRQITLINQGKDDEKMKVYRALRANKVKLGKAVHSLPQIVDQSITLDK